MYRKTNRAQLSIEEFSLPFGGRLLADNRWVKMAKLMPWDLIEDLYTATGNFVEDKKADAPRSQRVLPLVPVTSKSKRVSRIGERCSTLRKTRMLSIFLV